MPETIEGIEAKAEPAATRLITCRSRGLRGEIGPGGRLNLPGDKSLSHRAALFAALAEGTSRIGNFLVSGVTEAMLASLSALEVPWNLSGKELTVEGAGLARTGQRQPVFLNCGNSATTLRLLAGALAAWDRPGVLDGSAGLRRRPMKRILEPLQQMGVRIEGVAGCAPLSLQAAGSPLRPMQHRLAVASAQVKTCLLLAGLAADGVTTVEEPGPSRDHTERLLGAMGVQVACGKTKQGYWTQVEPPQPLKLAPLNLTLPGDISAAAFLIVAALIVPDSSILVRGVGLNPTRTGLLDTLWEMGARIEVQNLSEQGGEPLADLLVQHSDLRAVTVRGERVVRMIDEFPAFAVAAACAEGRTLVADAQELRYKESDRISALGGELTRLGIAFEETPDGFAIQGRLPIRGGEVESHGDHRLAMSLALAGLVSQEPVRVLGAEMIHESFPDFAFVLEGLGAEIHEETGFLPGS